MFFLFLVFVLLLLFFIFGHGFFLPDFCSSVVPRHSTASSLFFRGLLVVFPFNGPRFICTWLGPLFSVHVFFDRQHRVIAI